jgi:hypothetical protein
MSYVTIGEFQKYSNVVTEDTALQRSYIASAENIVENYLGYSPLFRQYSHMLSGNGEKVIRLKAKPIQSLLEVVINGNYIPTTEFLIENEFIYSTGVTFLEGANNVRISYFAGYSVGYSVPDNEEETDDEITDGGNAFSNFDEENDGGGSMVNTNMPNVIKLTVLRIAALLQTESDNSIGVTSVSFGESGGRSFLNYTNFDKYLTPISKYKLLTI